jgi:small subunit ribosomal protein S17e
MLSCGVEIDWVIFIYFSLYSLATMGRIRQTFIKRVGEELVEKHSKSFKPDFEANKKQLEALRESGELDCPSKIVRNKLAGYVTKRMIPREGPTFHAQPVAKK